MVNGAPSDSIIKPEDRNISIVSTNQFFIPTNFPTSHEFSVSSRLFFSPLFVDCCWLCFQSGFPNTPGRASIILVLCPKQSTDSIKSGETSKRDIRERFRQCIDSDCKLVSQCVAYIYVPTYICTSVDVRDCRSDSQSKLSILNTFSILPHLSLIPPSFRGSFPLFFT